MSVQADYSDVCSRTGDDGRAIRGVLDRIGDKWSLLTLITLEAGSLRHGQLKREVTGVSQRMLTLTLRQLERDGLVTRTVHPQVPPRVDYGLTPLGRTLLAPARDIVLWALANFPVIEQARTTFDASNDADLQNG